LEFYPQYVNSNDVVVEVGARVGGGTIQLSKSAKHVYSFEPNSDSCKLLKNNTKDAKNVTIFNVALGEKQDEATLNVPKYMKYSHVGTLKKRKDFEYEVKQKVKVNRMDSFNFPLSPTVLIIDCEGFEEEVLKGAGKILNTVKKVLVETHNYPDEPSSEGKVKSLLSDFNTKYKDGWVIATKEN